MVEQRGARDPAVSRPACAGFDWIGLSSHLVTLVAGVLVFLQPSQLMRDLT